ncbi:hypothetical protein [Lutibacter citreus]|uniref:hypothetical protein n=1 Tax=Lutibacter citreus TaxID=2138210 RepID=UPI0013002D9D|nr:hypothetical protein [Lutibacter citreus]
MINSHHLVTIEERKFPTLLFIAISFIIANWLLKTRVVNLLSLLYFGYGIGFIASYIFLFSKQKISLHTAAIGGLIGFLVYFSFEYKINILGFLIGFFILSGIIASARLRLKAHNINEVFLGFVTGLLTQFLVYGVFYYIM